ncbi:hypothetical protein RRG08_004670 [Elysia crispata]|uniref:Uncharacterized protein n=1 Tax=Elysia crispata TaxID=231223 RepID=A0AAE0ZYJ0_9GAST|nr:hypothetical protein RRG08_004670 [Elysia crispata]
MGNVAFTPKGDHIARTRIAQFTNSVINFHHREEEERHQKNLNENEQLKKQIAETALLCYAQFTEPLDRMHHTPDTSLITSQATARLLWSIILFGLWP